jgi:type IV pilus assembly protein PilC
MDSDLSNAIQPENGLLAPRPRIHESLRKALNRLLGDPIPADQVARFFETLATLLHSGMLVSEAMRLAGRAAGGELEKICESASRPVAAGVPLSRALSGSRKRFPPIMLPVLEVAELSGTLESGAQRLAGTFRQFAQFDEKYRYSVFDARLVIPIIALQTFAMSLSGSLTAALLHALNVLVQLIVLYLVGRLLFRWVGRWEPVRYALDMVKLAIPQAGTVARNLAMARWARSFATCWNAGVPISEALEVSSKSALNAYYERALIKAAKRTRSGWTLRDSLAETQLLPAYLLDIIGAGESSGKLGETLDRFAGMLEDEALTKGQHQMVTSAVAIKIVGMVIALGVAVH